MITLREKCPNTGKYGPEKTPYLDTFHTVTKAWLRILLFTFLRDLNVFRYEVLENEKIIFLKGD